jgi:hypothetical protein
MTPLDRLNRALVIQNALTELMTDTEADTYEVLTEHFNDYINDLRIDYQDSLGSEI